jgi:TatD DNase family protein
MNSVLYDAHNHLQDERLAGNLDRLIEDSKVEGIGKMVVNGSCEEDWERVLGLARKFPEIVVPSFGYHPWYVKERSTEWQERLVQLLSEVTSGVGEIGLDRWIFTNGKMETVALPKEEREKSETFEFLQQQEVFVWQLSLAAERNVPVSIHCLQAWGKLLEVLQTTPRPKCGFVLHSFGGPKEMIEPLAELGAYFSFPGYFAHARKERQRETFRHVPRERLLVETDAPDQLLPVERARFSLVDEISGKPLNHPANLRAVYEFVAGLLNEPLDQLAERVEQNFFRLFGSLSPRPDPG